jgi:hypothetical protein
MLKLPSKLAARVPDVLHLFAFLAYAAAMYLVNSPDMAKDLGLPAALLGFVLQVGGRDAAKNLAAVAMQSLPPAPTGPDGQPVDDLTHLLALAAQKAIAMGNTALATHLTQAPLAPPEAAPTPDAPAPAAPREETSPAVENPAIASR